MLRVVGSVSKKSRKRAPTKIKPLWQPSVSKKAKEIEIVSDDSDEHDEDVLLTATTQSEFTPSIKNDAFIEDINQDLVEDCDDDDAALPASAATLTASRYVEEIEDATAIDMVATPASAVQHTPTHVNATASCLSGFSNSSFLSGLDFSKPSTSSCAKPLDSVRKMKRLKRFRLFE